MKHYVYIPVTDAECLAKNLEENLQYDSDDDKEFWQGILDRLQAAIQAHYT